MGSVVDGFRLEFPGDADLPEPRPAPTPFTDAAHHAIEEQLFQGLRKAAPQMLARAAATRPSQDSRGPRVGKTGDFAGVEQDRCSAPGGRRGVPTTATGGIHRTGRSLTTATTTNVIASLNEHTDDLENSQ